MNILFFSLFCLGLASCVFMETCPPDEYMYPCTCNEDGYGEILVTCSYEGITLEWLKYALNSISGKEDVNLKLKNLNLGTVPSTFFYGIFIKSLEIHDCELDSLSDDGRPMLLGLETSLKKLTIISSFKGRNTQAKLQLGHMRRLEKIELVSNVIAELGDNWFDRGPASLEYLTISHNYIEKIGSRALANLINLKQLALSGNRFGSISRSVLPDPAPRLESLELDNNALSDLPEDIFSRMPALTTISLRENGISRLDQRTWYPVWQQLNVIGLERNPISCDGHMNWIFRLRKSTVIYGRCYSPREFENQSLQEFIDSRI